MAEPAEVLLAVAVLVPCSRCQHHCRPPCCGYVPVRITQMTSWIGVCAFYFALIAFYPILRSCSSHLIYAAAFGAYAAVDWHWPKGAAERRGGWKDMGIWCISWCCRIWAAITGGMISAVKVSFGDPTAYATAFAIGALAHVGGRHRGAGDGPPE